MQTANKNSGKKLSKSINRTDYSNKCRCCLSIGLHQHIFGITEIEMLKEDLNIILMVDSKFPTALCSACHAMIKAVKQFRDRVIATEAELKQIFNKEIKCENDRVQGQNDPLEIYDVKSEPDWENSMSPDLYIASDDATDIEICAVKTEIEHDDTTPLKDNPTRTIEGGNLVTSVKTQKSVPISGENSHVIDKEIHSDHTYIETPLYKKSVLLVPLETTGSELEREIDNTTTIESENKLLSTARKRKTPAGTKTLDMSTSKTKGTAKRKRSESDTSSDKEELSASEKRSRFIESVMDTRHVLLIDNGRVRSNIILLLKHSTIIPFRNNFKYAFKCFYCKKLYTPFKDLKEHVETEHKDVPFATISSIVRSMYDLIVTADISTIKCKLCDQTCETIESLIKHLCDDHGKVYHETERKPSHGILGVNLSTDKLKCHICDQDQKFFKNLLVHMNEHYGVFICYVCGKKFLSERRYKSHVSNAHGNQKIKCKECSKVFKTEPAMKNHVRRVHLKVRLKCLYCTETFTTGNYVKRLNHMAEVHGIEKPKFKCEICGRELANSGSLAHHKRYTHSRTNLKRCDLCGYVTYSSNVMKNHMIVHSGVKNFECEFCKKRFAKLGTLKLHLRIHLNDKRFVCFLCDAAFIQKTSLKNHLQSKHPDAGVDVTKI